MGDQHAHPVWVTAVLELETPTDPVTVEFVHVSAVLARTAKPAAVPNPGPPAWADIGKTAASNPIGGFRPCTQTMCVSGTART